MLLTKGDIMKLKQFRLLIGGVILVSLSLVQQSKGQIRSSGAASVPSACESNSGNFTYSIRLNLPNGSSFLDYNYSSEKGWHLGLPSLVQSNGVITHRDEANCSSELIRKQGSNPAQYLSARGSAFYTSAGQLVEGFKDGGNLWCVQTSLGRFKPSLATDTKGWKTEFQYIGDLLTKIKLGWHSQGSPNPNFVAKINRANGSDRIDSIQLLSSDEREILLVYSFTYRPDANGNQLLVAVSKKGRDGIEYEGSQFKYVVVSGQQVLSQIVANPTGVITNISYAQQAVGNAARTVLKNIVVHPGANQPPSRTEFLYQGGTTTNNVFSGFDTIISQRGGVQLKQTYLTTPVAVAGLPVSKETSSINTGQILSYAQSTYVQGGEQNKIFALKEVVSGIGNSTGATSIFRKAYEYDFSIGRVIKLFDYGQEDAIQGFNKASDDRRVEYSYLQGPDSFEHTLLASYKEYNAQNALIAHIRTSFNAAGDPNKIEVLDLSQASASNSEGVIKTTEFHYDPFGNIATEKISGELHQAYTYNNRGDLESIKDLTKQQHNVTKYIYDLVTGLVKSSVDEFGNVTTFQYDGSYRTVASSTKRSDGTEMYAEAKSFDLKGVTSQGSSNSIGQTSSSTEPRDTFFDGMMRAVRDATKSSGGYLGKAFQFDENGNQVRSTYSFTTDSSGFASSDILKPGKAFYYDDFNRTTSVTHDKLENGLANESTRYGEEKDPETGAANPQSSRYQIGQQVTTKSTLFNRQILTSGEGNGAIRTIITTDGYTTKTTDAQGNAHELKKDYLGRTIYEAEYGATPITYVYSPDGSVVTMRQGAAEKTIEIDPASGRVTKETKGVPGNPDFEEVHFDYDTSGNLVKVETAAGTPYRRINEYNSQGLVSKITESAGTGQSFECNLEYDSKNQLSKFSTVPNPNKPHEIASANFQYDEQGRMILISSDSTLAADGSAGKLVSYHYSDGSTTKSITKSMHRTGRATTWRSDSRSGRLIEALVQDLYSGNDLKRYSYNYDPRDPRLMETRIKGEEGEFIERVDAVTSAGLPTVEFRSTPEESFVIKKEYDALGRMLTKETTSNNSGISHREEFQYDPTMPYKIAKSVVAGTEYIKNTSSNGYETLDQTSDGHSRATEYTSYNEVSRIRLAENGIQYADTEIDMVPGDSKRVLKRTFHTAAGMITNTLYCNGWLEVKESENDKAVLLHLKGPDPSTGELDTATTLIFRIMGNQRYYPGKTAKNFDPSSNYSDHSGQVGTPVLSTPATGTPAAGSCGGCADQQCSNCKLPADEGSDGGDGEVAEEEEEEQEAEENDPPTDSGTKGKSPGNGKEEDSSCQETPAECMAYSIDEPKDKNGEELPEEEDWLDKLIKLFDAVMGVISSGALDEILANPKTRAAFLDACEALAGVLGTLGAPFVDVLAEVSNLARNWDTMSGWDRALSIGSIVWEIGSEIALGAIKKLVTVVSAAMGGAKIAAGLAKASSALGSLAAAAGSLKIKIDPELMNQMHVLDQNPFCHKLKLVDKAQELGGKQFKALDLDPNFISAKNIHVGYDLGSANGRHWSIDFPHLEGKGNHGEGLDLLHLHGKSEIGKRKSMGQDYNWNFAVVNKKVKQYFTNE